MKIDVGGRETRVKKALLGIRDRFHVEVEHGKDLKLPSPDLEALVERHRRVMG